jgi:TonB family protein
VTDSHIKRGSFGGPCQSQPSIVDWGTWQSVETSSRQRPEGALEPSELESAFIVAFEGKGDLVRDAKSVSITVKGASEVEFKPVKLVQIIDGKFALLSVGYGTEGNSCRGCSGRLNIIYLVKRGARFALHQPSIEVDVSGLAWGQPPEWNLLMLANGPMLEAYSSATYADTSENPGASTGVDVECQVAVFRLRQNGIVFDEEASMRARTKHPDCTNWLSLHSDGSRTDPQRAEAVAPPPARVDVPKFVPEESPQPQFEAQSASDAEIIASPVSKPSLKYPPAAEQRGIEGEVMLAVVIGPDGRVESVSVVSVTNPGWFEEAAVTNAKAWVFRASGRFIRFETVIAFKLQ